MATSATASIIDHHKTRELVDSEAAHRKRDVRDGGRKMVGGKSERERNGGREGMERCGAKRRDAYR
jgi:hypothetical protein